MPSPRAAPAVCLHSSAASGRQWRSLAAEGGDAWQWHMPDLYGHGSRPDWPELMPAELGVEANGVLAGLPFGPEPGFHLVGHSYGGAVALQIALQQPQRVLSLMLYEPVAFGALPQAQRQEIAEVAAALGEALDRNDDFGAARGFCAYWHGRDVWPELGVAQQLRVAEAMPTVRRHFDALFAAPWSDGLLGQLRMPVQLMCGTATRASARLVAQCLAAQLPQARMHWLEGAAHMAPLTQAQRVNAIILDSLSAMRTASVA